MNMTKVYQIHRVYNILVGKGSKKHPQLQMLQVNRVGNNVCASDLSPHKSHAHHDWVNPTFHLLESSLE